MPKEKINIEVKVQTRCSENSVEKLENDLYKVKVKALPVKGEANKAVIKLMADFFDVPQSSIRIVRGQKASRKRILIGKK